MTNRNQICKCIDFKLLLYELTQTKENQYLFQKTFLWFLDEQANMFGDQIPCENLPNCKSLISKKRQFLAEIEYGV